MNEGQRGNRSGVVGAGRLGCALAEALVQAGGDVVFVHSATRSASEALCERLPDARVADDLERLCAGVDRVWLTVPDTVLARVAMALPVRPGQGVVHTSGANDLSVLAPCAERGAAVGCFHPLQSFPARRGGAARLAGIAIGVEAPDAALWDELSQLAARLGASPFDLRGVDRARYHAAAVFASNYLVGLLQAASEAWVAAGLPAADARAALLPLTGGALAAVQQAPLAQALTGPLGRGDVETVARQLSALAGQPELRALYAALGRRLLALGQPRDPAAHAELTRLLAIE